MTRGTGRKGTRSFSDADGAAAGAAAAVGGGEGLVEIELDDVKAEIAGPGFPMKALAFAPSQ